jgi:hypothetical protein
MNVPHHRRQSRVEALAHWLSVEARRLSLLGATLRQLRKAINLVTREMLICLAVLLGIWHLVADTVSRLFSALFR